MNKDPLAPTTATKPKPHLNSQIAPERDVARARVGWGLAPAALALALVDWTIRLIAAPGRRSRRARKDERPCIKPRRGDELS